MSKSRKDLRLLSIIVLICVAISFVMTMIDICQFGLALPSVVIEGVSKEVIEILAITIIVFKLLFLFPQVYVGIKGIKEAKNPTKAKAHIVWAFIITLLFALATIAAIIDVIKALNIDTILVLAEIAIDTIFFGSYYVIARRVRAGK